MTNKNVPPLTLSLAPKAEQSARRSGFFLQMGPRLSSRHARAPPRKGPAGTPHEMCGTIRGGGCQHFAQLAGCPAPLARPAFFILLLPISRSLLCDLSRRKEDRTTLVRGRRPCFRLEENGKPRRGERTRFLCSILARARGNGSQWSPCRGERETSAVFGACLKNRNAVLQRSLEKKNTAELCRRPQQTAGAAACGFGVGLRAWFRLLCPRLVEAIQAATARKMQVSLSGCWNIRREARVGALSHSNEVCVCVSCIFGAFFGPKT